MVRALPDGLPAVDDEVRAGDEGRGVGAEVDERPLEVVRLRHPAHRNPRGRPLEEGGGLPALDAAERIVLTRTPDCAQ